MARPPATPPPPVSLVRFVYQRGVPLSRREQQIVWLMCQGLRQFEIAAMLDRAQQTIAHHQRCVLEKTHCRSQAQLGAWAALRGLVES